MPSHRSSSDRDPPEWHGQGVHRSRLEHTLVPSYPTALIICHVLFQRPSMSFTLIFMASLWEHFTHTPKCEFLEFQRRFFFFFLRIESCYLPQVSSCLYCCSCSALLLFSIVTHCIFHPPNPTAADGAADSHAVDSANASLVNGTSPTGSARSSVGWASLSLTPNSGLASPCSGPHRSWMCMGSSGAIVLSRGAGA